MVYRIILRAIWSLILLAVSLPGLVLWLPVFATTFIAVHQFKRTGPVWDTYDEIAQYKLTYGLASGLALWAALCLQIDGGRTVRARGGRAVSGRGVGGGVVLWALLVLETFAPCLPEVDDVLGANGEGADRERFFERDGHCG